MKNIGMTVLSVPIRLRLAAFTLLMSLPLVAFEVALVHRAPIWNLPYRNMGYWTIAFGLLAIPLTAWLVGAKKWALPMTSLLLSVWLLVSAWLAFKMQYPPLAFFTLLLLIFGTLDLIWLKHELERSFFDPQIAWYQGLPKPIPGLVCQLGNGENALNLRVSRIDHDGVIVFMQNKKEESGSALSQFLTKKQLEMTFIFRERQVACIGVPTLAMDRGIGAGIQFSKISSDQRKDMGDFVELLRGEGYVG
jgi:hypothetical protein